MTSKVLTLMVATLLPLTAFAQESKPQPVTDETAAKSPQYEETKRFADEINVSAARLDGRWRLLDKQQQQLLNSDGKPVIYDKVKQVESAPYLTAVSKGKGFLLDAQGQRVAGVPDFDTITVIDNSRPARYFALKKAGKSAAFDKQTGKTTDFVYDYFPHPFTQATQRIIFRQNRLYGILDSELKERLPASLDKVYPKETFEWLKKRDKNHGEQWGALVYKTNMLIPPDYRDLYWTEKYIFAQKRENTIEVFDLATGKIIKSTDFPIADIQVSYSTSQAFLVTLKKGKAGMVDIDGNVIIPHHYENFFLADVKGGKPFFAKKDGYYGLIDFQETIYIPFEYEDLTWYSEPRVVLAEKDLKWKFLTIDGKAVCDWQDGIVTERFTSDVFVVRNADLNQQGLVDKSCQLIVPIQFDDIKQDGELWIAADKNAHKTIYSQTGKQLAKDVLYYTLKGKQLKVQGSDEKWRTIDLTADAPKEKPAKTAKH